MRTKKAIAVLLVAVMLVVPFSLVSSAAGTYMLVTGPIKTEYTDCEHFIPQGISVTDGTEVVFYSPADDKWAFNPGLNELLSIATDETGKDINDVDVEVFYDNKYVGSVTVTVNHELGEVVYIGQLGHGQYCLGCGKVHNFEEHTVNEWIPNDDGGLIVQQTQTGTCEICKGEITENIPGSEKFGTIFDGENMTQMENDLVYYVYNILVSLIQMLIGIK